MPEGGCFKVKGNCNSIGIALLLQLYEYAQKTVDSIGKLTVLCGQQLYSVVCSVGNTVSVNNKKSHIFFFLSGYIF